MKKNNLFVTALVSATILAACSEIPKEAYFNRGEPESLMVRKTEEAHFDMSSKAAVKNIIAWSEKMKPSEATLHCSEYSKFCNKVEQVLERDGVATTRMPASNNSVTFTYEHVAARACENRYIDNMINPYNMNHPTFGCSLASNIAQAVTNKRDITDPDLVDDMDARKGVQATDQYMAAQKPDTSFAPISTSASLATSSGSSR